MGSPDFKYDAMKQIRVRSHECWNMSLKDCGGLDLRAALSASLVVRFLGGGAQEALLLRGADIIGLPAGTSRGASNAMRCGGAI